MIELNAEFRKALEIAEKTNQNVFITGRAGTGKSTLLTYFRNNTKKEVVVLAPTGVAALNVKGQTIHSFFKFKPDVTLQGVKKIYKKGDKKNLYEKIDVIVIDEISMVRSDLLDCMEKSLRLNRGNNLPFGGVQMIFIGDLYQLPPVVTGAEKEIFRTHYKSQYFFDANVFQGLQMDFVELEKVYRQKDDSFIALLNAVRNNSATDEHLSKINKRFDPNYAPDPKSFAIYLTTTNDLADTINNAQLGRLKGKEYRFEGSMSGKFEMRSLPTELELLVKKGSQVMMLNNDSQGRWVNGTIGKIVDIEEDEEGNEFILVEMNDGSIEVVSPFTWELFNFSFDVKRNSLTSETIGTFTQYPMRLAWAVTIHKSQGKTFDNIIIDLGRGTFVHGQLYVALSRCTSLEGITLRQEIGKKHIFMDWRVVKFVTQFQYQKSQNLLPLEEKELLLKKAIKEGRKISMVYLKSNDEKSKRIISPSRVGEMEFMNKKFLGIEAYDEKRQGERVFRIDRILQMEIV
jgi:ATP-dependent exoDNAse (exonuclease V) alpha subunit